MGPHPAVAAIRLAVRRVLHDVLNEVSRTTAARPAAAASAHPGAPTGPGGPGAAHPGATHP
ncbi:tRNA lysidine(34) synthetase TilS, partial [Streptomyces thermolilacinus]